jgi:hypothetical protein
MDRLDELRDGPRRRRSKLSKTNGSLRLFLMKEAWRESSHSLDNPGEVEQWYFEDEGIVLIELEPEEDDGIPK